MCRERNGQLSSNRESVWMQLYWSESEIEKRRRLEWTHSFPSYVCVMNSDKIKESFCLCPNIIEPLAVGKHRFRLSARAA